MMPYESGAGLSAAGGHDRSGTLAVAPPAPPQEVAPGPQMTEAQPVPTPDTPTPVHETPDLTPPTPVATPEPPQPDPARA
jgi:protein TonB